MPDLEMPREFTAMPMELAKPNREIIDLPGVLPPMTALAPMQPDLPPASALAL
jgi:hypothetical protein